MDLNFRNGPYEQTPYRVVCKGEANRVLERMSPVSAIGLSKPVRNILLIHVK